MAERARTVLVVEDEEGILQSIHFALREAGYIVATARNACQALEKVDQCNPDLLILDVMLPDVAGTELCRELRQSHYLPILFLSARDQCEDRVLGLNCGADDYLGKPFEFPELLARVAALLRRYENRPLQNKLELNLEPLLRQVVYQGRTIELTPLECRLLEFLMRRAGNACSREDLLRSLWGYEEPVATNCLEVTVSGLRAKLADSDRTLIRTIRGIGYSLG